MVKILSLSCLLVAGVSLWEQATSSSLRFLQGTGEDEKHLDIHYTIDMSSSIAFADPLCFRATGKLCWNLAIDYIANITAELVDEFGGWSPTIESPQGVQMSITAFSCYTKTGEPITENVTGPVMAHSDAALLGSLYILEYALGPFGGTCPSEALGYALGHIDAAAPYRDNQMVIILTDGLITPADVDRTKAVAMELEDTEALVFLVSIGYNNGWSQNLTEEIFGPDALLMEVEDFASLQSSIPELKRAIVDSIGGSTTPAPTPGVDETGDDKDINEGGSEGSSGLSVGGVVGVTVGVIAALGVAVGGVILAKRKKSAALSSQSTLVVSKDTTE